MAAPTSRTSRPRAAGRLAVGLGLGLAGGWAYGLLRGRPATTPLTPPLAAGSAGTSAPPPPKPAEPVPAPPAEVEPVSIVEGNFQESPVDADLLEGQIVDDEDTTVTLAATESTAADPLLAARERARRRLAGE